MKGYRNGKCTVCALPQRAQIDLLLSGGAAFTAIARRFKVNKNAVARHFRRHISKERKALLVAGPVKIHELAAKAAEEGVTLLDYLAILRSTLTEQYLTACEAADRQGTSMLAGRLIETLRAIGQITGELTKVTSTTTNNTLIMASPLMNDLQEMLIERLRPFPEAFRVVLEGLDELNAKALGNAPPALPAPLP